MPVVIEERPVSIPPDSPMVKFWLLRSIFNILFRFTMIGGASVNNMCFRAFRNVVAYATVCVSLNLNVVAFIICNLNVPPKSKTREKMANVY